MMNEEVFAQNQAMIEMISAMFHKGVVKISGEKGFLLASGKRSPVYLDHRKLFGDPGIREAALDLWCELLCENLPQLTNNYSDGTSARIRDQYGIAGTATAGIAPGFGLACRLGLPFAYVRSKPKEHGLFKRVEGSDLRGRKLIVIDDMVTTGASLLQACEALESETEACQIVLVSSFSSKFDTLPKQQGQSAAAYPFCSVFTLQTIFKVAQQIGLISDSDLQQCNAWL